MNIRMIVRAIAFLMFAAVTPSAYAQVFEQKYHVDLPDSISAVSIEPADVNNDGLIDLILFATSASGNQHLLFIKGDTVDGPALLAHSYAIPGYHAHTIRDFDLDNTLDLLLSLNDGEAKAVAMMNTGDFFFQETAVNLPAFNIARFADLDQDGKPEAVLSGMTESATPYTTTFRMNGPLDWHPEHDTLGIAMNALEILDLDGNGVPDVFYSGTDEAGEYATAVLIQEEGKFVPYHESTGLLNALICDRDMNGTLDVIAFGESSTGETLYQWFPAHAGFEPVDITVSGRVVTAFHADLNSDGIPDASHVIVNGTDTVNVVSFTGSGDEFLVHKGWKQQRFFDNEQDGDLDIVQVSKSDGNCSLNFFDNTTAAANQGPSKMIAFAFPVYDRVFLYWTGMSDDHTTTRSLTYDVLFDGADVKRDIAFDLANGKRLRTDHGNNGTNNFYLLANDGEPFGYAIQAVDNALYADPDGVCIGNGFNCSSVENEVVTACTDEKITFTSAEPAMWFSFSKGFLGLSASLDVEADKNDTLFYLVPTANCPVVRTVVFEINDEVTKTTTRNLFICKSEDVSLEANTTWEDIVWSSEKQGALGSSGTIVYESADNDVVKAVYKNESGCTIEEEFVITISIPQVTASPDVHRMMKGQSVTLSATGGVAYSWSPATGLSNPAVANPVATPGQDTEYMVTVTDSVGCTGSARAMVFVEATGFIPSLFTPNGDGQNDLLKVYGLADVRGFSLQIVNREGSVVYKTSSVGDALAHGWDGATNGVEQPNGVYFWRVEGALPSGRKLLLNGKEEGSLVLLR